MKKNYITPSTVAATWASMGLMDNITLGTAAASGGAGIATTSDANLID